MCWHNRSGPKWRRQILKPRLGAKPFATSLLMNGMSCLILVGELDCMLMHVDCARKRLKNIARLDQTHCIQFLSGKLWRKGSKRIQWVNNEDSNVSNIESIRQLIDVCRSARVLRGWQFHWLAVTRIGNSCSLQLLEVKAKALKKNTFLVWICLFMLYVHDASILHILTSPLLLFFLYDLLILLLHIYDSSLMHALYIYHTCITYLFCIYFTSMVPHDGWGSFLESQMDIIFSRILPKSALFGIPRLWMSHNLA